MLFSLKEKAGTHCPCTPAFFEMHSVQIHRHASTVKAIFPNAKSQVYCAVSSVSALSAAASVSSEETGSAVVSYTSAGAA